MTKVGIKFFGIFILVAILFTGCTSIEQTQQEFKQKEFKQNVDVAYDSVSKSNVQAFANAIYFYLNANKQIFPMQNDGQTVPSGKAEQVMTKGVTASNLSKAFSGKYMSTEFFTTGTADNILVIISQQNTYTVGTQLSDGSVYTKTEQILVRK